MALEFNRLNPRLSFDFSDLVPGGRALAAVILQSEPILYYQFEETGTGTVQDFSGNNHDGTTSSTGISFDQPAATGSPSEASFEFTTGFVDIPDYALLDQDYSNGLTVECWIKVGVLPSSEQTILSRGLGPGFNNYQLSLSPDGRVKFWFVSNSSDKIAFSTDTVAVNTWFHVAAVWDGATNVVYLNGNPGEVVTNAASPALNPSTGQVAAFNNGGRFVGFIDDLAIYDSALVQDDIDDRIAFDDTNNNAPVITSVTANGQGSGTLNIFAGDSVTLVINATDEDGDTLQYSFSTDGWTPSVGPQLSNTTTILYPEVGTFNPVGFVTDGTANRASNFPVIDVDPLPDLQAFNDSVATGFRDPILIRVLNNDSFPVGGGGSISNISTPSGGTAVLSGSGETADILYTPNSDFSGTDSFTYTITEGTIYFDQASVTVEVEPKQPPSTSSFSTKIAPDSTNNRFKPQSNDISDPPGEVLTLISVQNPTAGGGTVTIDAGTNEVVYTPLEGYTGIDSFSYQIEDEAGLTNSGVVNADVTTLPFEANTDTFSSIPYNTPGVTLNVLSNDTTPFGFPLSITGITQPPVGEGTVTIDGGATTLTYESAGSNFIGATSFTYDIDDGNGNTDTGTVNLTVVNRVPRATFDRLSTPINTARDLDVMANDTDQEGSDIFLISFTQPANGTTTLVDGGTPGDTTDDLIRYTPNGGFEGVDSFTYTIEDDAGQQAVGTTQVAVGFTLSISVNQTFGPVTEFFAFQSIVSGSSGFDKSYTYFWDFKDGETSTAANPTHLFKGIGAFAVECTVTDSYGAVKTDTVNVEVTANARPIANNITVEVAEGQLLNFDPRSNDSDPDGDLFFIVDADGTSAQGGTVSINNNTTPGTPYDDFLTYSQPAVATPFTDTFDYTIEDEFGLQDTATVTVEVLANTPPSAQAIFKQIPFETPTVIDPLQYATDPEGDDLFIQSDTSSRTSINGAGPANTLTYTPVNSFTGPDTFDYTIRDTFFNTDTSTVTISVFGEFYPKAVVDDSPISYWPLNEQSGFNVANDTQPALNNGTYVGTVTRNELGPLAKDLENAARVDGGVVNMPLKLATRTALQNEAFTLEFWVRNQGQSGSLPVSPFVRILDGGATWSFTLETDTGGSTSVTATGFELDEWYYVTMVYDGSFLKVFRDNAEAAAAVPLTGTTVMPTSLTFGSGLIGLMSDVALYDVALTTGQINAHYGEAVGAVTSFKVQTNQDEVSPGETFITTVKARDITDKTVKTDNATEVTVSSLDTVEFDADGDGVFGPFLPQGVLTESWQANFLTSSAVSSWPGRNGAYTLSQGDAGLQPVYATGTNTVTGDGTDYLRADTFAPLFNTTANPPTGTFGIKFASNTESGTEYLFAMGNSGTDTPVLGLRSDGLVFVRGDSGVSTVNTDIGSLVGSHYVVLRFNAGGAVFDAWLDGVQVITAQAYVTGQDYTFDQFSVTGLPRIAQDQTSATGIGIVCGGPEVLTDLQVADLNTFLSELSVG